jgi:hypothetical protein
VTLGDLKYQVLRGSGVESGFKQRIENKQVQVGLLLIFYI